jgi:hypothetical protein
VILGTAGVAVLVALSTTARGATQQRLISDSQAWLAISGDAISDPESIYRDCAGNSASAIATDYENLILAPILTSSAPSIDVVDVSFWNSATQTYGSSCRYASHGDRLQRVTVRTVGQGVTRTLAVVKRPPASDIPTTGVGPLPPAAGGNVIPQPNPGLVP